MGMPKGTIMNQQEIIATRLKGSNAAVDCEAPEQNPTKTVYFPATDVDIDDVALERKILDMNREKLIAFIEENGLDVPLTHQTNKGEKDTDGHAVKPAYAIILLANLRSDVCTAAVKAGLERSKKKPGPKPNIGKDKMVKESPVTK